MEEKKYYSKKRKYDQTSTYPVAKRARTKTPKKFASLSANRVELKCVDLSAAPPLGLTFNNSGPKALINGCVPGTQIQNRLGRRIKMSSVRIIGNIVQFQVGVSPVDDFCRLMLVYDRQPNGSTFVLADLLQSVDQTGATSNTVWDGINMSNSRRFKVLKHEIYKFECTGASANQPAQDSTDYVQRKSIDWYVPLKGLITQYNTGTAGTVADIQSGALYLFAVGVSSNTNCQYQLQYNVRLRFCDL